MKKIFFISKYYNPHIGGVERHLKYSSEELIKRGYKVTILTEKFSGDLKNKEVIDGVEIRRFFYPKIKFFGLGYIWYFLIKNRILIEKSDIVHCHDVFIWYLPLRFIFPRKPVYTTFHGYESYPVKFSAKIIRKLSEKLSWGSICIGDFMKKWYGQKPDFVSYGAVDFKNFKSLNEKRYKYDAIFSSRLDEQTGILAYIDVVREIRKKRPKFRFLVLGDGKFRKEAEKVGETLGFVDDPAIYLKSSHFAFFSRYLSMLEAFVSKSLVFAIYDNPIKKDYLEMTPFSKWIVVEKNPKKLAEKVKYYLRFPGKSRPMIDSAYEWVKSQTWENMVDLYLKLWKV